MNVNEIREKIISSFGDMSFEEKTHTYKLGGSFFTPVSNCISEFKTPFNSNIIAKAYAKKYGRTTEDVLKQWDDKKNNSCDLGTKTHLFGEKYFYNKELKPESKYEEGIVKFWNNIPSHIIPIFPEVRVYSSKYKYAGTIDNLFFNERTEKIIETDYKTNADLYKNFKNQKMKKPYEFLLDMPFSHYELQLSYYQIPLEDIGLEVSDRYIIWLKPDGDYKKIKTTDYTNNIRYYHSLKDLEL